MPKIIAFLFLLLLSFPILKTNGQTANKTIAKITVDAGTVARVNTPVSVSLENILGVPLTNLQLQEIQGGKRLPVATQVEPGINGRLWWILSGTTKAGSKRIFELVSGAGVSPKTSVKAEKDGKVLKLTLGDKNVLQYNYGTVQPPTGADPKYVRSGFIHPLYSPNGQVMTRIHAPDHYHHFGLWNPWTKTTFEGRHVDFWNIKDGTGTVRFVNFASTVSGEVFGGFRALQDHIDVSAPGGEKVAMNEEWDIRVWNIEGSGKGGYLVDFTSKLNCASNSPITFDEYRYGGFGWRGWEGWDDNNAWALTSEGKNRKDIDGSKARWANVYGATPKGNSGIVFLSHPHNYNYPEPVRMWPLGSNKGKGNVFFNFAPTKDKDWKLEPGQDYVLKYRMLVYDGEVSKERAEQVWQDFGNPPVVKLELTK